MRDYITLGTSPVNENCVCVTDKENYMPAMLEEARRFKSLLESLFPTPEDVIGYFTIKSFPHDFGTYLEVCAVYDDEEENSANWAYGIEDNLPENWVLTISE